MFLCIEVRDNISDDIADCAECHSNSFARIHDGHNQHDRKRRHARNRNQWEERNFIRQVFHLATFRNISLPETILADTDHRIHENVCAAYVPDNHFINSVRREEFRQNTDQREQHGNAQSDNRPAFLARFCYNNQVF